MTHKQTAGGPAVYPDAFEDGDVLLIVGRTNKSRRSAWIDALIRELQARGLSVFQYTSATTLARRTIDAHLERAIPVSARLWLDGKSPWQTGLRTLAKTIILLLHPRLWWSFSRSWEERYHTSIRQLRRFARSLRARRIFVLSHSAGGIAASLIANEAPIEKLICFGYPFRHPGRDEEPRRTAHLPHLRKPFLIIQGEQDQYGRGDDVQHYVLSPTIRVEVVPATHDYNGPLEEDFRTVLAWVMGFLEMAPRSPPPDSGHAPAVGSSRAEDKKAQAGPFD